MKYSRMCVSVFLLLHALLSLSGGFLLTAAMMAAPQLVEAEHQAVVGAVMVLTLVAGLLAGAVLSFGWLLIL